MSTLVADPSQSQELAINSLRLMAITILYYDHLITFGEEYMLVWRARRSRASVVFLVNRYFAFLVNIALTVGSFITFTTVESCSQYSLFRQGTVMTTQFLVGIVQFLRIFALYNRKKRIAALIVIVGVGLFGVSVWAVIGQKSDVSLGQGCHNAASKETAIHLATAWEALFLFDLMIFLLTVYKTKQQRGMYSLTGKLGLVELILRDGAIYFGIMVFAQAANVLTFYLCSGELRGDLSFAASAISVTMMSRLMLNLYKTAEEHLDLSTMKPQQSVFDIRFNPIVDSSSAEDDDDDDDDTFTEGRNIRNLTISES